MIILGITTTYYHLQTTRHTLSPTYPRQSRAAAIGILCGLITLLEATIGLGLGWGKREGDAKVEIALGLGL